MNTTTSTETSPTRKPLVIGLLLLALSIALAGCLYHKFSTPQPIKEAPEREAAEASNQGDTLPDEPRLASPEVDTVEESKAVPAPLKALPAYDLAYGEHEKHKLDIYGPSERASQPIMLYVHGGAWAIGDKRAVHSKAEYFVDKGWLFISINYRLTPEVVHPEHVRDTAKAIAWVLDNIAAYGGDAKQLYLMGHSAGAHLVSLVATDERRLAEWGKGLSDIKGVISNDINAYDLVDLISRQPMELYTRPFGTDPETLRDASPMHHLAKGKGIPPFLITRSRGMSMRVNPNRELAAEGFAKALRAVDVEASVFDGSDRSHGEINHRIGQADDDLTALIWETLQRWQKR
ncbi:MAG: alpha/beta hydrolase [Planctomycetes bacterium]|nr:alpha/beta hydrolase [Planctomycetota bacterium]